MPNADTHDIITYVLAPFTYLGAEMYWGADHLMSVIATGAMLFSGLMFGPDLDLMSRPYKRWGPLRFIWKPYQIALPHRSTLSHGPVLGTAIRIVYFALMFSLVAATVLYLRHVYIRGMQTTWAAEFNLVKGDMFSLYGQADKNYLWAGFLGLCLGALSHTAADITWSTIKSVGRSAGGRSRRRR
ncbi:MAG: metal-binding protein [Blastocatellia bacterium]